MRLLPVGLLSHCLYCRANSTTTAIIAVRQVKPATLQPFLVGFRNFSPCSDANQRPLYSVQTPTDPYPQIQHAMDLRALKIVCVRIMSPAHYPSLPMPRIYY
ncbi:hypothetical protein AVEN_209753-1 [Araneus ventricosus]|uniref:Uncharacterized protein n=1 Tax=Araneus ventricosus TaxID=182803 RepID=A0A4Y2CFF6_ARAVE|nr:hypothetical protein AVEN_209753-1 [Araneus ventricosus]